VQREELVGSRGVRFEGKRASECSGKSSCALVGVVVLLRFEGKRASERDDNDDGVVL
jgi:hypothetical protein